jgi:hypothetical protein
LDLIDDRPASGESDGLTSLVSRGSSCGRRPASAGNRVAAIKTTAVRVIRLGDVDLAHALGEGEGYDSVAEWAGGA